MGKTNLLDAIHYLSLARSHIGSTDRLAVQFGKSETILSACYNLDDSSSDEIVLRITPDKPKVMSRNGKSYQRLSEHIGRFPLVVVSPQDGRLTRGGSADRRLFIDRMLVQQNSRYLDALVRYEHALKQRNSLIKNRIADPMLFDSVELVLATCGTLIYQLRKDFIEQFIPRFQSLYTQISGDKEHVSLRYSSHVCNDLAIYRHKLLANRIEDGYAGHTTYGIHKDDVDMLLGEEQMKRIGSEGQNKTYVTALKLGQYMELAAHSGRSPILLLDDLFDKLDAQRVSNIIRLVSAPHFGQIFITDTNRQYLDRVIDEHGGGYRLFSVVDGAITPL